MHAIGYDFHEAFYLNCENYETWNRVQDSWLQDGHIIKIYWFNIFFCTIKSMGDKLTDYYDVHNVLYVLFLLRCYGTLVDTGVDERTTIKIKLYIWVQHTLSGLNYKWQMILRWVLSILLDITCIVFFTFESFNFQFRVNFTQMEQMNSLHVVSKYKVRCVSVIWRLYVIIWPLKVADKWPETFSFM